MEIDVILILNLEHRPDRFWATYGALVAARTPLERIRRVEATPGSDFKDKDALVHAATEDGFPEFSYLVRDLPADDPNYQIELNIKSQAWNYCQMLRYLKDTNQSGLILYDDRYVKEFENLESLYKSLLRSQPRNGTLILQLDYYFSASLNPKMRRRKRDDMPYIKQGPSCGSDNAMLYSAAGAEWFLSKILEPENEYHNVESTINRLSFLPAKKRSDFWSCDLNFISKLPGYMGSNIQNPEENQPSIPTINES